MKYIIDEAAYNAIKMAKPWFWAQHKAKKIGTCETCKARKLCADAIFDNGRFCDCWKESE